MNLEEFIEIVGKVSDGNATVEELRRYNHYFNQYQVQHPTWDQIDPAEQAAIKETISRKIKQQIEPLPQTKKFVLWSKYAAAVIILCVLSFTLYFYLSPSKPTKTMLASNKEDLSPGGNQAFLTLSNGQKINLNDANDRLLDEQGGILITKTADGELSYHIKEGAVADTGTNVIETPTGGQYRVRLQDGTIVWLNASTSLRYPVRFMGNKRVVEVRGEAYFEVAHHANMPFVVKSAKQEIEVLGTHFNVMAYADETAVETTLMQGAVKIRTAKNSLLLKPGQQAKVVHTSAELNPNADIETSIAWRSGKIQFADMDIQHIMRMLSRWYNFEVAYKDTPTNTTFGGSFSRSKNLSVILKALETTGDVHFKIEGRRVIVMP